MNILQWPAKFSDEVLDYEVDWSAALDAEDAIQGEPDVTATLGVTVETKSTSGKITRLRLAGGSADESTIDLLLTAASGQKIGARVRLPIRQR